MSRIRDRIAAYAFLMVLFGLCIGAPIACNSCETINPNQEALSLMVGMTEVHAEDAATFEGAKAGDVLTAEQATRLNEMALDAASLHRAASKLYEPYRPRSN